MDRRYGKVKILLGLAVIICIWKTCYGQDPRMPLPGAGESDPRGGILSNFFNMHKLQPVRSYSIYGNAHHNGPFEVEQFLPSIVKPEKDFKVPPEVLQEILRRHTESKKTETAPTEAPGKSWLSFFSWKG